MPAPHAVAAHSEAIIKPTDSVSDIRIVEVPTHWPPADWPQAQGQVAHGSQVGSTQHQGGEPAQAPVRPVDPADGGQAWPRQFAVLLAETLAGVRPVRQLLPWLSERGRAHLHRLLPLFADGHRPHIARVLTARPAEDVIEMTLIITFGPRTRALAVRLERTYPPPRPAASEKLTSPATRPQAAAPAKWRCTDIEAA